MFNSPPQSGPTEQELQAARDAREAKVLSTQDVLRQESDRLFRLYGASNALFGKSSGITAQPLQFLTNVTRRRV